MYVRASYIVTTTDSDTDATLRNHCVDVYGVNADNECSYSHVLFICIVNQK